jgi:hypothetical protein
MLFMSSMAQWLKYQIMLRFSNENVSFSVAALPITYYNETEMRKDALSLAQSGYSFIIPMMTFDLEQRDLIDLKKLEINALQLNKIMIPLASSFTTSSGNPNQEDVNKIDDDQKSDKTIQNINAES